MENVLRNIRNEYGITQNEAALAANISRRTYHRYESDINYGNKLMRESIISYIKNKYEITEEKGVLSLDDIKNACNEVFSNNTENIQFAYLFGSYAKGYYTEKSDVDILISTDIKGFSFVGLVNSLSEKLHKKVDLLRFSDELNNKELLTEIMKDGIKIYG